MMCAVFGGVLLCSCALERLSSVPVDAIVRAVDARPVSLTGTIDVRGAEAGLVFHSAGNTYTLSDLSKARSFAGRPVRITGVLHESTGLIEIRSISDPGRS